MSDRLFQTDYYVMIVILSILGGFFNYESYFTAGRKGKGQKRPAR